MRSVFKFLGERLNMFYMVLVGLTEGNESVVVLGFLVVEGIWK